MSPEENKELIRRYIEAIDANDSDDWSVLDEFIAEDFIAHNPPIPGVTLDRDGMKQAAEIFRMATPGDHEITMQAAEGALVVSYIVGRGVHAGELLGILADQQGDRDRRDRNSTGFGTARSSSTGRSSTSPVSCSR
jgi:hypothetical protein